MPHSFSHVPCFKYLQSLFLQAQEDATNVKCSVSVVFIVSNTINFFLVSRNMGFFSAWRCFFTMWKHHCADLVHVPRENLELAEIQTKHLFRQGVFFIIYCLVYMHLPLQIQNLWLPSENTLEIECETIHVIMI